MNWIVKSVTPQKDYKLLLTFANGEIKLFDMKPYIGSGFFEPLKDVSIFNTVCVKYGTIEWINGADLDPESLYNLAQPSKSDRSKAKPLLK